MRRPRARPRGPRRSPSSTRWTPGSSSWRTRAPPAIFARHEACAAAARAGLAALGFELLADPASASRTVTAARVPDDLDWKAFNDEIKARGVVLAGGQGKLTGQVFRLGHLGSVTLGEILDAISVIEEVSIAHGRDGPGGARGRRRPARRAPVARACSIRWAREDPRRRTGRPRGRRAPPRPSRGRRATRPQPGGVRVDHAATTTRSSSAARSRSTPSSIAAGRRLVVIGRAGVGVDNVDLDAATRAGIVVVNAPTGNTIAAAEHTLALLYALARRVAAARRVGAARRVEAQPVHRASSCAARPSASSGLGKIGQAIAKRARAMEMTVLGGRPVRVGRAGRPPRRRAGRVRRAPAARRRDHRSTCPSAARPGASSAATSSPG